MAAYPPEVDRGATAAYPPEVDWGAASADVKEVYVNHHHHRRVVVELGDSSGSVALAPRLET